LRATRGVSRRGRMLSGVHNCWGRLIADPLCDKGGTILEGNSKLRLAVGSAFEEQRNEKSRERLWGEVG
jgi:hypothetical protein